MNRKQDFPFYNGEMGKEYMAREEILWERCNISSFVSMEKQLEKLFTK